MRRTKAQLNAISKSYTEKKHIGEEEWLKSHSLYEDYKNSKYKYMCNYIKAVKKEKNIL